jgi:hypothetical protein
MNYTASLTMSTILQSTGLDARNRANLTGLPSRVDPVTALTPNAFERSDLALLIDEMSLGVVLVNSSGQVCHSSRAARESMLNSNLLRVQAGQLQATSPVDHKALLDALSQARNGLRSLLELSSNGASLFLSVVPLARQFAESGAAIGLFFSAFRNLRHASVSLVCPQIQSDVQRARSADFFMLRLVHTRNC